METVTNDKLARDVLIIDDNADLAQSLRELLQYYGCRVETAADGFEGVRKAISGRFDVIFIDIAMPGMTGYEVARAIRAGFHEPVVLIAQTAYGQPEDFRKAIESGFNEHLIKPVEPSKLIERVAAARSLSH
jgi:two-component system CheB/CheR fusion protein